MKTLRLTLAALLLLGVGACKKSSNNPSTTTDQSADLITASLSVNADGALSGITDVSVSAQAKVRADSLCGAHWADSVSRSAVTGNYSHTYKAKYSYTLNCSQPATTFFNGSATVSSSFTGSYNGPRISSTHSGTTNYTLSGLGLGSPVYVLNGEFIQSGSHRSNIDSAFAGNHSVDIVIKNLTFTKPLRVIESGSATISVGGNTRNSSFQNTGALVFNGGNKATLTVNGSVYIINLLTGEKVKQ